MGRITLIILVLWTAPAMTLHPLWPSSVGAGMLDADDRGMLPDWVRDLPFPAEYAFASTFYAEVNGLPLFIATGTTRDDRSRVMSRVREVFPDKERDAEEKEKKIPTFTTGDTFWQVLGLDLPSKEEAKEAFEYLANDATRSEHGKGIVILEAACVLLAGCALQILLPFPEAKRVVWRTMLPILTVVDTLCELLPRRPDWCYESDPIKTLQAISQILPQLRWHTVSLSETAQQETAFRWVVWNGFEPEHLFALFDPQSAQTLCDQSPFSWPSTSECVVVARFLSSDAAGMVSYGSVRAPFDQVRDHFATTLHTAGWSKAPLYPAGASELLEQTSPQVLDALPEAPGFEMWSRGEEETWVAISEDGGDVHHSSVLLLTYREQP